MSSSAVGPFLTGMAWLLALCGPLPAAVSAEQVLLDFGGDFDVTAVQVRDVKLSRHERALRLGTGHNDDWPGITLGAPQGRWDLAAFEHVAPDVANVGSNEVEISCREVGYDIYQYRQRKEKPNDWGKQDNSSSTGQTKPTPIRSSDRSRNRHGTCRLPGQRQPAEADAAGPQTG